MKTLLENPKKINATDIFLANGIIEKLYANSYTCIDYSDDESFLELEYKNGNFRIERTNLDLTEEQIDTIYKMLLDFIEENEEPTFDNETPFHPYNQAI